jgi:hypothetical protein
LASWSIHAPSKEIKGGAMNTKSVLTEGLRQRKKEASHENQSGEKTDQESIKKGYNAGRYILIICIITYIYV